MKIIHTNFNKGFLRRRLCDTIVLGAMAFLWIMPDFVRAQGVNEQFGGSGTLGGITNPIQATDIPALVTSIVDILIQVGAVLAVVMIIWTGFKYVTAGGEEKKITEAHAMFKWTVIGAAVLLGAKIIVEVIKGTVQQLK